MTADRNNKVPALQGITGANSAFVKLVPPTLLKSAIMNTILGAGMTLPWWADRHKDLTGFWG